MHTFVLDIHSSPIFRRPAYFPVGRMRSSKIEFFLFKPTVVKGFEYAVSTSELGKDLCVVRWPAASGRVTRNAGNQGLPRPHLTQQVRTCS